MGGTPVRLSQNEKFRIFHELHHGDNLLVLPNIWDPLGGLLLERLGYPAIATASAAIAYSNGYNDGEHIPFTDLVRLLKRIVESVNIPVSADIESGYAATDDDLGENIRLLVDAGISGINIEDSDKKTNSLIPVSEFCQTIRLVKETADKAGQPLFVNARSDVYIRGTGFNTPESRLAETLKRGSAYKEAGADCFYPITLAEPGAIRKIVDTLQMPVNILLFTGAPDLKSLKKWGWPGLAWVPLF